MKNYHSSQNGSGIIDTWMTCLTTNTPPLISGASSFESMKAVFAALESAEKGCVVNTKICPDLLRMKLNINDTRNKKTPDRFLTPIRRLTQQTI